MNTPIAPVLATLALLAACSGGGASDQEARADPTAAVRTALAVLGASAETVTVYGVAEAEPGNQRALTVQAEGVLVQVLAPTGTAVRAGQVIATLRPSPAARLDTARAANDAASADAAYARARRLRADGLVSDADVEAARAAAAIARAARATTAQRTATLTLRAPAAGTVQNLAARPGDVIAAGTTLATIAGGGGDLRARFGIDPAVAVRIGPGAPIRLAPIRLAPIAAGAALVATVSGIDPQPDATTRLASVYARVQGGRGIAAGEPLRGTIQAGGAPSRLTIPYAALLDDGGRSYVFVVAGGVAHRRAVSPGSGAGDRIGILAGLAPGERVVTEGGTALDDGMKVREGTAR